MRFESYGERNWDLSCVDQPLSRGSVLTHSEKGVYLASQCPSAGLHFVSLRELQGKLRKIKFILAVSALRSSQ